MEGVNFQNTNHSNELGGVDARDKILEIEGLISNAKIKLRNARREQLIAIIICLLAATFLWLHYSKKLDLHIVTLVIAFVIFFITLILSFGSNHIQHKAELEKLQSFKDIYSKLTDESKDDYFNKLVEINVYNLSEYYTLVKLHSKLSFRLASVAGVSGFVLILISLAISFSSNSDNGSTSFISAGTGIIIEFISGVFFYLYNKTVRQLKGYHDSLLDVQNILLSFKLVNDVKEEKDRILMIQKMIEFLMTKKAS